jgi:hypothetical protein
VAPEIVMGEDCYSAIANCSYLSARNPTSR